MIVVALLLAPPMDADGILERVRASAPRAFRATLCYERGGKRVESVEKLSGTMVVRTGDALAAEFPRRLRLFARGGRLITIRGRSKTAYATAPSFHPLDFWRQGGESIAIRFDVSLIESPGGRPLPPAVSGPGGKPIKPVRAVKRFGAARSLAVAAEGTHHAGRHLALRLVPRDAALRRRLRWVRLFVDRTTFRIARVEVEGTASREAWTVTGVEEADRIDASAFEPDLSGMKLEER